jgi:adenine-specific DNA-methyltransferase
MKKDELIAEDPKSAEIIRPILRGRDIKRYSYDFCDLWLINTHNGIRLKGVKPINIDDYPAIKKHLDDFYFQLEARADKGETPYNLRNCAYIEDFSKQKIIYPNMTKFLPFVYDNKAYIEDFSKQKIVWGNLNLTATYCLAESGIFVNAPCPMIIPASNYLLAVLNSKLADYYIRSLGVTRNGGYFEYKPMFIEQLPVPINIEPKLSKIIEDYSTIIQNNIRNNSNYQEIDTELNKKIYELYDLNDEEAEFIKSQ